VNWNDFWVGAILFVFAVTACLIVLHIFVVLA
jgi:hypothetical protein